MLFSHNFLQASYVIDKLYKVTTSLCMGVYTYMRAYSSVRNS